MDCICLLLLDIVVMQLDKSLVTKTFLITSACFILTQLTACLSNSQLTSDRGYLVSVAAITENSDRFLGNSVLVRNDIVQTIGTRGFILDKDRLFDGGTILVINTSEVLSNFSDGQTPEVLVDGRVERFNLNSLEQEYNLNLESSLYDRYEGKPVIIARSIILSPDPEDLTAHPEIYYHKPLAIKGEVDDITDYGVFELDEEKAFGGEDLLVVQSESKIQLYEEQTVIVYGNLRQFVADDFEEDYDLGWDSAVKSDLEAEYNRKPVFVAKKIQFLD